MNDTTDSVEPSYDTKPQGGSDYIFVVGLFSMVLLLIALIYASYVYKRSRSPTIYFGATNNDDAGNHNHVRFSRGLDDDVLVTFPTFLYSEAMTTHKGDSTTVTDVKPGGCSICLADYKPVDVVRLLPECGHLFHMKCIDTWLKANPTCPVCRNSSLARTVQLTDSMELTY